MISLFQGFKLGSGIYPGHLTSINPDTSDMINTDQAFESNSEIFPNPNNGEFYLKLKKQEENICIRIYTLDGTVIYSNYLKNLNNSPYKINLSENDKGLYIIKLTSTNGNKTSQILIIE